MLLSVVIDVRDWEIELAERVFEKSIVVEGDEAYWFLRERTLYLAQQAKVVCDSSCYAEPTHFGLVYGALKVETDRCQFLPSSWVCLCLCLDFLKESLDRYLARYDPWVPQPRHDGLTLRKGIESVHEKRSVREQLFCEWWPKKVVVETRFSRRCHSRRVRWARIEGCTGAEGDHQHVRSIRDGVPVDSRRHEP